MLDKPPSMSPQAIRFVAMIFSTALACSGRLLAPTATLAFNPFSTYDDASDGSVSRSISAARSDSPG